MESLQDASPSSSISDSPPIYTFLRPYPQQFSLPYPIIKYIIQNPQSGNVWKKLILSCKYFYSKNPVFPVKWLDVVCDLKCKADGEYFDSSLTFPKLWIYDSICAVKEPDVVLCSIPKIFKYDLRLLEMKRQRLTMKEYQKLTSSGSIEQLCLDECQIKNEDGTSVTIDKILENLQYLEAFEVKCCFFNTFVFQHGTVEKMVQHLNRFTKMRYLKLHSIAETFEFSDFTDFLMMNETIDIDLSFDEDTSDPYREIVENVIEEIKKNLALKVPVIQFL